MSCLVRWLIIIANVVRKFFSWHSSLDSVRNSHSNLKLNNSNWKYLALILKLKTLRSTVFSNHRSEDLTFFERCLSFYKKGVTPIRNSRDVNIHEMRKQTINNIHHGSEALIDRTYKIVLKWSLNCLPFNWIDDKIFFDSASFFRLMYS